MKQDEIRGRLIDAGVTNLREFGYPLADKSNIMTDSVYALFFLRMLESDENKTSIKDYEQARLTLIAELKGRK